MSFREIARWLFHDALNITVTSRLWCVDSGGWYGGHFKNFWLKKNAVSYAKQQVDLFVEITNRITNETIRVRNNPNGEKPGIMIVEKMGL